MTLGRRRRVYETGMLFRFQGGKKEELIGIAYNRLIRMDASTSDAIKTWRFSNMKQWNVNWEIKMVSLALAPRALLGRTQASPSAEPGHRVLVGAAAGDIWRVTRAEKAASLGAVLVSLLVGLEPLNYYTYCPPSLTTGVAFSEFSPGIAGRSKVALSSCFGISLVPAALNSGVSCIPLSVSLS